MSVDILEFESEMASQTPAEKPELPASILLGDLKEPTPGDGKELIADRYLNRHGSLDVYRADRRGQKCNRDADGDIFRRWQALLLGCGHRVNCAR